MNQAANSADIADGVGQRLDHRVIQIFKSHLPELIHARVTAPRLDKISEIDNFFEHTHVFAPGCVVFDGAEDFLVLNAVFRPGHHCPYGAVQQLRLTPGDLIHIEVIPLCCFQKLCVAVIFGAVVQQGRELHLVRVTGIDFCQLQG